MIKSDKQDIFDKTNYNITDAIDTQDSLKRVINYDSGRLYNLALSISELTFSQPIDIEEKITNELVALKKIELEKLFNVNIEYLEIRNKKNLQLSNKMNNSKIFVAYNLEKIRLIDNF